MEISQFPNQSKIFLGKPLTKTCKPSSYDDVRIISRYSSRLALCPKYLKKFCIHNYTNTQCKTTSSPILSVDFAQFGTSIALINVIDDIPT